MCVFHVKNNLYWYRCPPPSPPRGIQTLTRSWDERFGHDQGARMVEKSTHPVSNTESKHNASLDIATSSSPHMTASDGSGPDLGYAMANGVCTGITPGSDQKYKSYKYHQISRADDCSTENSAGSNSKSSANTPRVNPGRPRAKYATLKGDWLSYLRGIFPVASEQALRRAIRIGLQPVRVRTARISVNARLAWSLG